MDYDLIQRTQKSGLLKLALASQHHPVASESAVIFSGREVQPDLGFPLGQEAELQNPAVWDELQPPGIKCLLLRDIGTRPRHGTPSPLVCPRRAPMSQIPELSHHFCGDGFLKSRITELSFQTDFCLKHVSS